jgi:hypothetical protein
MPKRIERLLVINAQMPAITTHQKLILLMPTAFYETYKESSA